MNQFVYRKPHFFCDLRYSVWNRPFEVFGRMNVIVMCRQAADTAMQSAAYYFAQAQRGDGAIVLASNDQGFSKVLEYCASLGCNCIMIGTVSICTLPNQHKCMIQPSLLRCLIIYILIMASSSPFWSAPGAQQWFNSVLY